MRLTAFEIPESPKEIALWLESVVCEGDLRELVAQLSAVHSNESTKSLSEVLGEDQDDVLRRGLAAAPVQVIRYLLCHPAMLLDLQELVIIEGDAYWENRFSGIATSDSVVNETEKIILDLRKNELPKPSALRSDRGWNWRPALGLAATISFVLICGWQWYYSASKERVTAWGWQVEIAHPETLSANEYLSHLAQGAQDWFNKRPVEYEALEQRLKEFHHGCERLLVSSHAPLSDRDRRWLIYRCMSWKVKLEDQIEKLPQRNLEQSRNSIDLLATEFAEELKKRAKEANA